MFRIIFTKQLFRAQGITRTFSSAPAATAQPSIKDLLIDLTFVDPSGARRKAKGMIGTYSTRRLVYRVCLVGAGPNKHTQHRRW
jgi:hypothetical protein